ncbi:hypothetical protein [Vibrio alginolyticus]|uniref:hypothetical protein n=1 Tax=Vibrio alginolyticus TaxID=663 RepID=UPI00211A5B98|nr:hypothetical protein [Vibrio alginolyticus]MCQ9091281.1 hypothetical protein [Vibrio alginolyticus]
MPDAHLELFLPAPINYSQYTRQTQNHVMTLMLYPNKHAPKGWRLQDRVLNEQHFFSAHRFGSLDKAKREAEKVQARLATRRHYHDLRQQLDINRVFYPDGRVRGLQRKTKCVRGQDQPMLIAQVTVNGKQVKTDRRLANRCFHEVYTSIQAWILDKRGITRTQEITQQFEDSAHWYR